MIFLLFLSTLSLRRATRDLQRWSASDCNFYPRSPCGERRHNFRTCIVNHFISIHALLAESDTTNDGTTKAQDISIHALLAESDTGAKIHDPGQILFLSTLSLRRATFFRHKKTLQGFNFYPRSPCGERRWLRCWQLAARDISIHALLAESDRYPRFAFSTSPRISIHALLAESDIVKGFLFFRHKNFYPRSPCGERRFIIKARFHMAYFYPRSPCGERPPYVLPVPRPPQIFLSTLSLRRATPTQQPMRQQPRHFYPRSPCGERRAGCGHVAGRHEISIHALLAESDLTVTDLGKRDVWISIHALLAESDALIPHQQESSDRFLSTLSLRRATRSQPWRAGQTGISIHALLAESDERAERHANSQQEFLSTLSLRRATGGPGG